MEKCPSAVPVASMNFVDFEEKIPHSALLFFFQQFHFHSSLSKLEQELRNMCCQICKDLFDNMNLDFI
jgi:hypothetical protein